MRGLTVVVLWAVLAGCANVQTAAGETFEGLNRWFSPEKTVKLEEVWRAQQCGTAGEAAAVRLFTLEAAREWADARGFDLRAESWLDTPYALVEMGQRNSGGYGLAVSQVGGSRGKEVLLRATFISPAPDAMTTQALTAPCALVRLPAGAWSRVLLIDQAGVKRAASAPS